MVKKLQKRRKSGGSSIAMHTALEARKMLAGDVGVSLDAGALTFVGSFGADSVQIVQQGDSVSISGLDGTTINGQEGPFVVESGARDLSYRGVLRGGDDVLSVEGLDTTGSVRLFGSNGDDSISVENSQIDGVFGVFGGNGNDEFSISDADVSRQVVLGGGGTDSLTLAGDNSAGSERVESVEETIVDEGDTDSNFIGLDVDGGNVTITGTNGNDGIIVHRIPGGIRVALSRVTGNVFEDGTTSRTIQLGDNGLESLTLNLGEGNDGVFISGVNGDSVSIDGGDGVDSAVFRGSDFAANDFDNLETVR